MSKSSAKTRTTKRMDELFASEAEENNENSKRTTVQTSKDTTAIGGGKLQSTSICDFLSDDDADEDEVIRKAEVAAKKASAKRKLSSHQSKDAFDSDSQELQPVKTKRRM